METQNLFISGVMNSDIDNSLSNNKSYSKAVNLRISGKGKDGVLHNIKGHTLVSSLYAEVGMVVLGAYEGRNNKTYFLLAHSNWKSKIIEYDTLTGETRLIIQDNNFLRFDLVRWVEGEEIKPYKYILSINQIGDFLHISNENWEYPRVINITRDYTAGFVPDDIILAKKPPALAPQVTSKEQRNYENDDSNSFWAFSYRYKYVDNYYSALSVYSETVFEPEAVFKINSKRENTSMVNKFDYVKLMVNSGNKNVTDIEVYAREHGSNTAYMIYSANKVQSNIADNTAIYDIEFKFSKNYEALTEEATKMLYSNVPKFPKAQTIAGSRLIYGNYKEGFDLDQQVDFEVKNVPSTFAQTSTRRTAISLFKYKVGVIYLNDYNESSTILLPVNQTKSEIDISFSERLQNNNLQVKLNSSPPSWATKMKFAVKSTDLNFDSLYITYVKKIGVDVYLYLNGETVNKVKKDDILIRTDVGASKYKEFRVVEVKNYTIDDGMPVAGLYAQIVVDADDNFKIEQNSGTDGAKNYNIPFSPVDSTKKTPNPMRYVSSVYTPNLESHWNRGFLNINDYGEIKEGDSVTINITMNYLSGEHYVRPEERDMLGSINITEDLYASSNYTDIYEFIINNFENPYIVLQKNGTELRFLTNVEYPELVRAQSPFCYAWQSHKAQGQTRYMGVRTITVVTIRRGVKQMIFRTKNDDNLESLYYETEKTYSIVNGNVVGDGVDQNSGKPIFNIGFYNGFNWANGMESYKIKDTFNGKAYAYKFRGSLFEKSGYKRIHRKNDLTYSGIYNYELSINNLSEFNPTTVNWKNLPINYGEIQRIMSTDGDITVFCNDKIINQFYGKSILMDIQGSESIGISNEVLGSYFVLPYEFGISEDPATVAKFSNILYFTDRKRGRILAKSGNEIQEINNQGSGFYYESIQLLQSATSLIGSYDEKNNEYIVGFDHQQSIGFNPFNKGFSSYYTYKFDYLIGSYGKFFTGFQSKIYENETSETYNDFAGQGIFPSLVKFVVNPEMGSDKVFQAMHIYSNTAWNTEIKTSLAATKFTESNYDKRESFFYTNIFRDSTTKVGMVGVGVVQSISGNVINFKNVISNQVSAGDTLSNESGTIDLSITDVQENSIKVSDPTGLTIGDFTVAKKQEVDGFRPNGVPIRGEWMEVTLSKTTSEPIYITSISTQVVKSGG